MQPLRSKNESGHFRDEPALILLWRQSVNEALQVARRKAGAGVVLVRLMNQALDDTVRAACRSHGVRVVALPLAFAGLREGDRVLRDAVLQRLEEQRTRAGANATAAAALPA